MYPISDIECMPGKEKKNAMMRIRACTRNTEQKCSYAKECPWSANSSLPLGQRSLSHYWDDELMLVKTPGVTSISLAESHLLTSAFWFRKQKVCSWEGRLHSFICLHVEKINTFMRAWDKLLWFQMPYVYIKNLEEFVKCKFPVLLSQKYNPEGL